MTRLDFQSRWVSNRSGFTLIELVIVIITLGILAAVAIPKFSNMANSARINASKQEMLTLKQAIVGNPGAISGGEYIDRGFEGDVGFVPSSLTDLAIKPDSVSVYDNLTRLGWNGPYIDTGSGDYLKDAWGNNYIYRPATRQVICTGGDSDTIFISF